jgi:hypothetical protein
VKKFISAVTRNTRWLSWVGLVFTIQIAIIVWFSDYAKPSAKKPVPAPTLRLAGPDSFELLALRDPTLFALPHFQGFSGDAWLKPPTAPERSFEWTEEPRWLALEPQTIPHLPAAKVDSLNAFEVVNASAQEPPSLMLSPPPQFPENSTMKIDGALARRKLLAPPTLPSWASTNLLTNTVIRVIIDDEGLPRSQTLLVRSGVQEADDYALKTARGLRFEASPIAQSAKGSPDSILIWGEIVFRWHGTPPTGANK